MARVKLLRGCCGIKFGCKGVLGRNPLKRPSLMAVWPPIWLSVMRDLPWLLAVSCRSLRQQLKAAPAFCEGGEIRAGQRAQLQSDQPKTCPADAIAEGF